MAVILNYLVLGVVVILLAWWLMPDPNLWIGFVLVAAGPPGVVVIPFTHILKGNLKFSLIGLFGAFILSVVITPLMVSALVSGATISTARLLNAMALNVLVPLFLSRVIILFKESALIEKHKGNIINWCFFLVIFSAIGLNRDLFFSQPAIIIRIVFIAFISTFVLGRSIEFVMAQLKVGWAERQSYMLLATIKTAALSSSLALTLFNETAALPGAVVAGFYAFYFIYLGIRADRLNDQKSLKL